MSCYCFYKQAYTSQIVVMAMLALAIGDDTSSSLGRRESIIDGLFDLPSMFQLPFLMYSRVLSPSVVG